MSVEQPETQWWFVPVPTVDPAAAQAVRDTTDRTRLARLARLAPGVAAQLLAARAVLRAALTAVRPDVAPADWRFVREPSGRPLAVDPRGGAGPSFSVSHKPQAVAVAVDGGPGRAEPCPGGSTDASGGCGIDVVDLSEQVELAAVQWRLSPTERRTLGESAPGHRQEVFHRLWARKEALFKATGEWDPECTSRCPRVTQLTMGRHLVAVASRADGRLVRRDPAELRGVGWGESRPAGTELMGVN